MGRPSKQDALSKRILNLYGRLDTRVLAPNGVASQLKINRRTAYRALELMVQSTQLEKVGEGKSTMYQRLNLCQDPGTSIVPNGTILMGSKPDPNGAVRAFSDKLRQQQTKKDADSGSLVYTSISSLNTDLDIKSKGIGVGPESKPPLEPEKGNKMDGFVGDDYRTEEEKDAEHKTSRRKRARSKVSGHQAGFNRMAERMGLYVHRVKGHVIRDRVVLWADDFGRLVEVDKVPLEVAEAVLEWYCTQKESARGKSLPGLCWTGKAFRKAFTWIFDLYDPTACFCKATPRVKELLDFYGDRVIERGIDIEEMTDLLVRVQSWGKEEAERLDAIDPDGIWGDSASILEGITSSQGTGTSFVGMFFRFLMDTTEEWTNWKKSLVSFLPGERYFMEFLQYRVVVRWGRPMTGSESLWFSKTL